MKFLPFFRLWKKSQSVGIYYAHVFFGSFEFSPLLYICTNQKKGDGGRGYIFWSLYCAYFPFKLPLGVEIRQVNSARVLNVPCWKCENNRCPYELIDFSNTINVTFHKNQSFELKINIIETNLITASSEANLITIIAVDKLFHIIIPFIINLI